MLLHVVVWRSRHRPHAWVEVDLIAMKSSECRVKPGIAHFCRTAMLTSCSATAIFSASLSSLSSFRTLTQLSDPNLFPKTPVLSLFFASSSAPSPSQIISDTTPRLLLLTQLQLFPLLPSSKKFHDVDDNTTHPLRQLSRSQSSYWLHSLSHQQFPILCNLADVCFWSSTLTCSQKVRHPFRLGKYPSLPQSSEGPYDVKHGTKHTPHQCLQTLSIEFSRVTNC